MRVAIPTNDKERIFRRSGRAKGFLILDIDRNGAEEIDYVINNHDHGHHHHRGEGHGGHGHSHKEIVDKLKGCEYIIVNIIGSHFGGDIMQAGIKVFKTNHEDIQGALEDFRQKTM